MSIVRYYGEHAHEEQHKGCVIGLWEHNGYEDSDFYAKVIIPETGEIKDIEYDTTRFPCSGHATVDLTIDNYQTFLHNKYLSTLRTVIAMDKERAQKIEKGKTVIVRKGRKVPHGIIGKIFWERTDNYYGRYGRLEKSTTKIGIKDEQGNVYWTYAENCEVLNPTEYRTPIKELIKKIRKERSKAWLDIKERYAQ